MELSSATRREKRYTMLAVFEIKKFLVIKKYEDQPKSYTPRICHSGNDWRFRS
jgi:hypothetical protein